MAREYFTVHGGRVMIDRDEILETLVMLGGYAGRFMVWMSMLAGCILLWYFVFAFIKAGL